MVCFADEESIVILKLQSFPSCVVPGVNSRFDDFLKDFSIVGTNFEMNPTQMVQLNDERTKLKRNHFPDKMACYQNFSLSRLLRRSTMAGLQCSRPLSLFMGLMLWGLLARGGGAKPPHRWSRDINATFRGEIERLSRWPITDHVFNTPHLL